MTNSALRGVIAAVATPFDANGEPDLDRFVRLAKHLLANGCDALNVCGTTGEATSMSVAQRRSVMETAARHLPRERLMVGTGAAALADAAALTAYAGELGFAGALLLPPFYYKGVSDDGVAAYVERVAAAAPPTLPLYLYHFPVTVRRAVSPRAGRAPSGDARPPTCRSQGFVGRYGLCPISCGSLARVRRVPEHRGGAWRGARRHLCRLHLGHGQRQRGLLRRRLARGRRRCAREGRRDPNPHFPGTAYPRGQVGSGEDTLGDESYARVLPPLTALAPAQADRLIADLPALAQV